MSPPASDAGGLIYQTENFLGIEISNGQLLLVYFRPPPDFEVLGAMRPVGP